MVLANQPDGPSVLFIERARHPGDPWSGHMAFPGGRVDLVPDLRPAQAPGVPVVRRRDNDDVPHPPPQILCDAPGGVGGVGVEPDHDRAVPPGAGQLCFS